MSTLDMEVRFLATDIRNLTDDLTQIKAWIGHWQEDVAANLKPTTSSLDAAMHSVKTCLRAVERIRSAATTSAPDALSALKALMAHMPDHPDTIWLDAEDVLRRAERQMAEAA